MSDMKTLTINGKTYDIRNKYLDVLNGTNDLSKVELALGTSGQRYIDFQKSDGTATRLEIQDNVLKTRTYSDDTWTTLYNWYAGNPNHTPAAYWHATSSSQSYTTVRTSSTDPWAYGSTVSSTYTHNILNSDYFTTDTNGFKMLISGYYAFFVRYHFNTANTGQGIAYEIYNYTQQQRYGAMPNYIMTGTTWGGGSLIDFGYVNANDVVIPRFQHYNGSGYLKQSECRFLACFLSL